MPSRSDGVASLPLKLLRYGSFQGAENVSVSAVDFDIVALTIAMTLQAMALSDLEQFNQQRRGKGF
jgi:hypothetical protein